METRHEVPQKAACQTCIGHQCICALQAHCDAIKLALERAILVRALED